MADEQGIDELLDIEAIRQLKAKYVRYGDTQQWDKIADLFTEDYEASFEGLPRASRDAPTSGSVKGRDVFVGLFRTMLAGVRTVHHVHSSEITITGPGTATGIWSMHDWLRFPTCIFEGWGHYHEEYVKAGGAWKLSKCRLTRLRTEETWL